MTALDVQQDNSTVLQNLKKGELIEFKRGRYSHWAVYIGDGNVIHLAGDENAALKDNVNSGHVFTISGARFSKADVKKDTFWNVTHGSKAYIRNEESPFKAEEIVRRAADMIGKDIGYNVLWNNCEHFAFYCRHGKWESKQSDTFLTWVGIGIVSLFASFISIVAYPFGRSQPTKRSTEKNESE